MTFFIVNVFYVSIRDTHLISNAFIVYNMATLNMLVSELANSLQQQNSVPVRRALALSIIHTRNYIIRHSYENHSYIDKGLQQRFKVKVKQVPDGDMKIQKDLTDTYNIIDSGYNILRTVNKVPRPVRLINNLPFQSVRTVGVNNPIEIAFVREASSRFYNELVGFCPKITYDYINDYIYINYNNDSTFANLEYIVIESPFEYPNLIFENKSDDADADFRKEIDLDNYTGANLDYLESLMDNEFLISEDMIPDIKKLVISNFMPQVIRDTEEVPVQNRVQ